MPFVIAPAERQDVVAMAQLFQEMDQFYDEPSPEPLERKVEQINALIFSDTPSAYVLLAWDDSQLAGIAAYSFLWPAAGVTRSAYLKELYVARDYRRRGVGKLLIQNLFSVAADLGCSRVEWTTDADNTDAQRFYQELGIEKNPSKVFYRLEDPGFYGSA
jgi:GNAT superfamily N-acetyltransferase